MAAPGSTAVLSRPPAGDLALLGVAVVFIASSGPIIAAMAMPALAIAFWRCFLGSAATAPWVLLRQRSALRRITRAELRLVVLAGLLLGAHFATWIPSLRFTTVASSTALVATQPVWAALIARRRGADIPRLAWIGIGVSLAGVLLLALTAGAQLLGHTLINKVLATTSATVVSLAILLEMPGATIIAAIALGQLPPVGIIPAAVLIFAGIVMVIRYGTRDVPTESSPV